MSQVNILFNAYGNDCALVTHALSNKLYDAFYMGLPLLTSADTAMSEEAGAYSYDLDMDSVASMDGLYNWYYQIDAEAFLDYSRGYLQQVFADQDALTLRLCKAVMEKDSV